MVFWCFRTVLFAVRGAPAVSSCRGNAVSDKPLRTHVPPGWTPFKTIKWPKEMDEVSKAVPEWA